MESFNMKTLVSSNVLVPSTQTLWGHVCRLRKGQRGIFSTPVDTVVVYP